MTALDERMDALKEICRIIDQFEDVEDRDAIIGALLQITSDLDDPEEGDDDDKDDVDTPEEDEDEETYDAEIHMLKAV